MKLPTRQNLLKINKGYRSATILLLATLLASCSSLDQSVSSNTVSVTPSSKKQQNNEFADATRLKGLAYWSGLFEEYRQKMGYYPLQDRLDPNKEGDVILVKMAMATTQDETKFRQFRGVAPKDLYAELSKGLGRPISEKFNPYRSPMDSAIGYFYFATPEGYLLWTPCLLCEITPISTYLMDGETVTLNIASEGMVDKVHKAQTREQMLNHPIYKRWLERFEQISVKE